MTSLAAFCHLSILRPSSIRYNPEEMPEEEYEEDLEDDDCNLEEYGPNEQSKKKGRCDMHFIELANGLALSLVERKENKKVINYWAPFQDLYKVLRAAFKFLFDRKNKRFPLYQKSLAGIQQRVIRPSLPGTTRVAGALIVHQQSLQSMHAWRFYST